MQKSNNRYKVIYADPPWEYKQTGSKTSCRGMAKQHYNTMSTAELCNLDIRKFCYDDSVLFLWATFPNIDQALVLIRS